MYKIKCEIEGVSEMLQDNPWNIEECLKGKTTTVGAISKFDERQLYKNDDGICCVPARHIKGSMKMGAKKVKHGRATITQRVKACLFIEEKMIPLAEGYDFVDKNIFPKADGKQQYKERPGFNTGWKLEFTLICYDDSLPVEKIEECLNVSGLLFGVGARRPDYGRFIVTKCEEMKLKKVI